MSTPRTVAFHTLGCKLNYSETSSIRRMFEEKGYTTLPFEEEADIYVLNTCSVTDFADQKCRQLVRRVRKQNDQAHIVVTGCYAQLKPQEIADIPGVSLVLGAGEKFRILDYLDALSSGAAGSQVHAGAIRDVQGFEGAFSFGDRTRSFLKVQDGCDYKCTFCTIPMARGASRSPAISELVAQARQLAMAGTKEIVLTGVNIGDFGNTSSGSLPLSDEAMVKKAEKSDRFIDLIRALDEVHEVSRYRISSIEPNLCSEEIIAHVASSSRFMPHFHMPLQSGSNRILGLMRRRYLRELYADRVHVIKSIIPDACIGVDVIVGFPGETEEDFQETYSFIQQLPISYLHVFTYSERPNTPAASMPGSVPMGLRRKRNELLRQLSDIKRREFYNLHVGSNRVVLLEQGKREDEWRGFTDNYIAVILPNHSGSINDLMEVRLLNVEEDGECLAEFVVPNPALVY